MRLEEKRDGLWFTLTRFSLVIGVDLFWAGFCLEVEQGVEKANYHRFSNVHWTKDAAPAFDRNLALN